MPIVRELYQTLNRFLHCGPMLDARTPLAQPLKLDRLVVVVETAKDYGDEMVQEMDAAQAQAYWAGRGEDALRYVSGYVRELESTGLLDGFVGNVEVLGSSDLSATAKDEDRIWVRSREKPGIVPSDWDEYGFEWGFVDPVSGAQEAKQSE